MSTPCPCPHPPGGSVTCAGNQFAYCHRINGDLRSGCIPISAADGERPTPSNIVTYFSSAMSAAEVPDWQARFIVHAQIDEVGASGSTLQGNLGHFLYEAMDSGRIVQLIGQRRERVEELLLRFPSIWSRQRQEPEHLFHSTF